MIRMISSTNFKNSDSNANFSVDSGEPETDDFAALLDGMSFVIPPIIQQSVNLSANLSPENSGENSTELLSFESFGDGVPPLSQFDKSVVLPEAFGQAMPKEFTANAPENLFAKIAEASANAAENELQNAAALSQTFGVEPEIPPVKADGQVAVETEIESLPQESQSIVQPQESTAAQTAFAAQSSPNQFAAQKDLPPAANKNFAKKDLQETENTGERNSSVNPAKNLFDQIESVQTETNSTESGKSPFKISENQLSREMFGGEGKNETPNKLPKLFREVSCFFEVLDLENKYQPQVIENAAPVPVKSADVAAQIEPQIVQMIALAIKTEKPQILKMRLNPAELGVVEIKIEKDAAGKINAHFTTEKEETRKILTENLPQLRDSLQDSGWQVERVEVSCSSFSFGGNEARESSSQAGENAARNSFAQASDASGQANTKEDLNSEKSDRLLSVRA